MFFTFHQNNSGGGFVTNAADGISHYVIIEAASAADANQKAEALGVYFDGVDEGFDCKCCGDRWYRVSADEATETPEVYGKPPDEHRDSFVKREPHTFVHYLDGRIKSFGNP